MADDVADAASARPWLVLVDPQVIFASPEASPWGTPHFDDALPAMLALPGAFPDRTVVTRFVADPEPRGSWVPYYREWPFALVPDDHPLHRLDARVAPHVAGAPVVTEPTFSKWTPALRAIVGEHPHLVLAGVSTECCVLGTALAAADGGATVTVVTDACAGSDAAHHDAALTVLETYAPQITLATSAEVRGAPS